MRNRNTPGILVFLFLIQLLFSCKNSTDKVPVTDDPAKWSEFVKSLEKEIGSKGGYADINYQPLRENDAAMLVQLSTDTNKINWKECTYRNGSFSTKRSVKFDSKGDAKPNDFLYTINDYDLNKVYNLVQKAKQKLAKEKNITGTSTVLMSINSPTIKTKSFEEEFNTVVWQFSSATGIYYTFRFNYKDSCEMMSELPKGYKL